MHVSRKTHAWLQMIRPPNLVTVPGDPLAGSVVAFYLGADGSLINGITAAAVALVLYICGLIMNDYADVEEDTQDRPDRPIPSGAVSPVFAFSVALVLAFIGIAITFLINIQTCIITIFLFSAIALYNFIFKRYMFVGSIFMGLCRGLSLLLGASAVGYKLSLNSHLLILIAIGLVLYISALTCIASDETEKKNIGVKRWFPTVVLSMLLIVIVFFIGRVHLLSFIPGITAVIRSICIVKQLKGIPETDVVQKSIGGYIRILLLIQASICFILPPFGIVIGGMLLLLWPLGHALAKKFYAS